LHENIQSRKEDIKVRERIKKILSVALLICILFSVCACVSDTEETETNASSELEVETSSSTEGQIPPEQAQAEAISIEKIKWTMNPLPSLTEVTEGFGLRY